LENAISRLAKIYPHSIKIVKFFIFGTAIVLLLFILTEVGLRLLWGLGNPPLYIADKEIGYLLAPNQNLRRFGNLFQINRYSMRSDEITLDRPNNTTRIFLLGDSVANGSWWTDRQQTISALIQTDLPAERGQKIEVLNASANSWCPRNQVAYLRRYGTFSSQIIILLINTDDLFGTAPTSLQVGRDRNYPNRKPVLALTELLKSILPETPIPELAKVRDEKGDRVGFNIAAMEEIYNIAKQNRAKLVIAITPLLREVGEGRSRDYELKARQRLKEFITNKQIPFIDFIPIFNSVGDPKTLYRDDIHLTPEGNRLVSQNLIGFVE
jgi:GDSL-like Lipase/Acylhydrolase family